MFIHVFLLIIATSTAILAIRAVRPTTKKKYFTYRRNQTQQTIWELEFKISELKQVREGIRQQFDRINENVVTATQKKEEEQKKDKPDTELIKKLDSVVEKFSPDLEHLKQQLKDIDSEIEGDAPTSVANRLAAAASLKEMQDKCIKRLR